MQSGIHKVLQLARSQEKICALDITGTASADDLALHMQGTAWDCISHMYFAMHRYRQMFCNIFKYIWKSSEWTSSKLGETCV